MQLPLETALADYLSDASILPGTHRIYRGHAAEVIPSEQQSYLRVVAQRPERQNGGVGELPVELQLYTGGIEDEARRPALVAAHDELALALYGQFVLANIATVRAAINGSPDILVSGWEQDGGNEDGRSESQLFTRLRYRFWAAVKS